MKRQYEVICKCTPVQIMQIDAESSWKAAITAAKQIFPNISLIGGLSWQDGDVYGYKLRPIDESQNEVRFTVSALQSPFQIEE